MTRLSASDTNQFARFGSMWPLSCPRSSVVATMPDTMGASSTPPTSSRTSGFGRISSTTVATRGANLKAIATSRISAPVYDMDTARLSPSRLAARLPSVPPASTQYQRLGGATINCARRTALVSQMGAISPPMVFSAPLTMQVSIVTTNASSRDQMAAIPGDARNRSTNTLDSAGGPSDDFAMARSLYFFFAFWAASAPVRRTTGCPDAYPLRSQRTAHRPYEPV